MSTHAQLDWLDGQPVSVAFGDVYFSRNSGLDETRHVFIHHNQLQQRFAALPEQGQFCIGETGFGTGLNFLCAWQAFLAHAPQTARLHFISAEKYPLTPADLQQALQLWPELAREADQLLQQYDALSAGWHRFVLENGRILLTLLIGDVLEVLPQLDARIDAWFLDGFAPSKNPDMWQPALFAQMARLAGPDTTFATFTSAGFVRRGLKEAGFSVKKVPGHGQKREMSCGQLVQAPAQDWTPPWYARPAHQPGRERSAIVVGGGIAGASTAYSLAIRGWQVTLVERMPALAQAASGNPQGVLYTKLSAHFTPLTRLVLAGYAYSLRQLHQLLPQSEENWQACGVLQLAHEPKEAERQSLLAKAGLPSSLLRQVGPAEASALAGIALQHGGLFFPQGGWLHPPALVRALCQHPEISLRTARTVVELDWNPQEQCWLASDEQGPLAMGSIVVLATAADTTAFDSTSHLPLKAIRGQVSTVAATTASHALQTVLCGEGYISPVRGQQHCLGATFKFDADNLLVNSQEHAENLSMLAQLAPALHQALEDGNGNIAVTGGRAAYRCTSPDYLPLIGPVANRQQFAACYRQLANDATLKLTQDAPWIDGLYVNTAHGSRGMITAPLSGEILAAYLDNEPAPLPSALMQAVHPSRFMLRQLVRKQT
ncbi:tRNA (5-methylaminomethyl-2-thiouridylate)-methyltransferase [Aquitalea magnusonii]|uniref:tRNA 5-methylaminomethyl-2-thiouridine biosynthesis bifunctional protein MnmC n=1 Tax=Aquitalea magnusonii TaxID=332411 RepID=A0A3G9G9S8_9NEIS|nr:bifunctional tRNA (5-methylaminomethyl-2-thiouridine)(34)-methyltransferase MnmD/FAD-dependent 5-carboxymethylaminomethyl-2-thiouridine(34) oxidoreductase MnmC [Aquitalea magnusonii]BBF84678.1 tRNA (5-methylaminomethyl-2-thiouridylate)-methyltransferase [Aquitalea magnusonii]